MLYNRTNYSAGEWSPKLDARVDQPKYGSALRQCLNMVPYKSGGLTRRVGTQKIAKGKLTNTAGNNYAIKNFPFIFSPTTTFNLEFGHRYIRFYSNGVQVNVSSAPGWITTTNYPAGTFVTDPFDNLIYYSAAGINGGTVQPHADPANWVQQTIYEVPSPYNANTGANPVFTADIFAITACQINDVVYLVHPRYPPYSLSRIADTDWVMKLVEYLTPALLDKNITNTVITPSALQGNSITLTASAPAWVSQKYYTLTDSVEVGGVIYNCALTNVSSGSFPTDLNAGFWTPSTVFNSAHIGSTWQLSVLRQASYVSYEGVAATGFTAGASTMIQCKGDYILNTYGVWTADVALQASFDGGLTWTTVTTITGRSDSNENRSISGTAKVLAVYRISVSNVAAPVSPGATIPRIVFECAETSLFGLVKITAVANTYSATANVVTQLSDSNPLSPQWVSGQAYLAGDHVNYAFVNYTASNNVTSATPPSQDQVNWAPDSPGSVVDWSEAAWSGYRGYPQAVTAFQQRVIYASSGFEPQRIWGTVTNDIENFTRGDSTLSTDSFAFDINAPGRGPILWMISQTDLFLGFSGAEWVVNSGSTNATASNSGAAITATNINAFEQGTFGSAPKVQPAIIGNAVFFAQRQADAMRQMLFSVYTNKYMSHDLTEMVDHLFSSGIVQIAYQARWRHQGIIWIVTQQGTMCGLTYDLDQEVFGWCQAQTGYGQVDPNGVPIPNDNGFESVAVIPGQNTQDDEVWVVANRLIGGIQTRFIERLHPLNWEETFTGAPNPPAPYLPNSFYVDCGITIANPGSLVLTGLDHLNGRYVVGLADGLPFGPLLVSAGSATLPSSFPTTVSFIRIGLPISYAGQPTRIDLDQRAGNTQGLVKQISDVFIRVWNSMGGFISNGTSTYPLWVSGASYAAGTNVISPLTQTAFQCVIAYSGTTDPSASASWAAIATPSYQRPVPIPYTNSQTNPFATPTLITAPTDIRITPALNPSPDADPIIIVQGNDALPLTVLGITLKYEIISTP